MYTSCETITHVSLVLRGDRDVVHALFSTPGPRAPRHPSVHGIHFDSIARSGPSLLKRRRRVRQTPGIMTSSMLTGMSGWDDVK